MKHREDMEDLDRKLEEKSKKVTYSEKVKKLNQKANKYKRGLSSGDTKHLTEFTSLAWHKLRDNNIQIHKLRNRTAHLFNEMKHKK